MKVRYNSHFSGDFIDNLKLIINGTLVRVIFGIDLCPNVR